MFLSKIPLPKVEKIISLRRGYWSRTNNSAGKQAKRIVGGTIHFSLSITVNSAEENAISIAAIETNSIESPAIIFVGSETKKSSKEYLAVSIPRKMRTEVQAEKQEIKSKTMNMMKCWSCRWKGVPFELSSVPPGTVKTAAKVTVTMRAATKLQDIAVSFIHFSASCRSPWCSFVNISIGVCSSVFTLSFSISGAILSTSYIVKTRTLDLCFLCFGYAWEKQSKPWTIVTRVASAKVRQRH